MEGGKEKLENLQGLGGQESIAYTLDGGRLESEDSKICRWLESLEKLDEGHEKWWEGWMKDDIKEG